MLLPTLGRSSPSSLPVDPLPSLNGELTVSWHRAWRSLVKELLVAGSPSEGAWTGHALNFGGTVACAA